MKLTELLLKRKNSELSEEKGARKWSEEVQAVPIHLIVAGKYQPRQEFDEEALAELAESIRIHGLLQPIMVRRAPIGYELIVGERRLRACKRLGWEAIPAIVRDVDDKGAAELALIENLQRADLHVLEVAEGYQRLLTEFNLTQEELAQRLGISQASVANKIRLLKLPQEIREIISREMLSERHSRALLRLESPEQQFEVAERIIQEGLSVKQTEELVEALLASRQAGRRKKKKDKGSGKQKLVIKDLRIFSNSVRQLTRTLESSGLAVSLDEQEDEDVYQVVITVRKGQGSEVNG
ncbi:MAG: ParB/RepB/Spo0J family partition protein [Firmicutes bacterium]|nr:ParB/RepB/Spo0J family partition protein [Bacillota bacterium]